MGLSPLSLNGRKGVSMEPQEPQDLYCLQDQELQVYGGIISSNWLWKKIGIDTNLVKELLKKGWDVFVQTIDELVAKTPAKYDDMVWGWVKSLLSMTLNKPTSPTAPVQISGAAMGEDEVTVHGSAMPSSLRRRSRKEVEDEIIKQGGDVKKFSPLFLLFLQMSPVFIQLIRAFLNRNKPEPAAA